LGFIEKHSPDAQVVVARELTKMHEEYLTGTAGEIIKSLKTKTSVKGEITLLISFK
jgi:16S rRNA (cytidine1402-2'-O)-methyltransferase